MGKSSKLLKVEMTFENPAVSREILQLVRAIKVTLQLALVWHVGEVIFWILPSEESGVG